MMVALVLRVAVCQVSGLDGGVRHDGQPCRAGDGWLVPMQSAQHRALRRRPALHAQNQYQPCHEQTRQLSARRQGRACWFHRFKLFSANLMPSLTPTSAGKTFSAALASRSL